MKNQHALRLNVKRVRSTIRTNVTTGNASCAYYGPSSVDPATSSVQPGVSSADPATSSVQPGVSSAQPGLSSAHARIRSYGR